jgi:TolB protein
MSLPRVGAALLPILALCVGAASAQDGVLTYCLQPLQEPPVKQISIINADGTADKVLTRSEVGLNYPDWSPDGARLAAGGYVSDSTWSIYRLDADGGNLVRLTKAPDVWDSDPDWSPDGSKIVFSRRYPKERSREELWVVDANGGTPIFTGIKGSVAHWSPDGKRFLYQALVEGTYRILVRAVEGGDATTLVASAAHEMVPAWSPDGSRVAFTSMRDGNAEIYVMNADGSGQQRLTRNSAGDYSPAWSPDGSHIAWDSDRLGDELWIMRADGSDQRRLTHTRAGATAINPDWKPVVEAPDAQDKGRAGAGSPRIDRPRQRRETDEG